MILKLRSSGEVSIVESHNLRELKVVAEAGVSDSVVEGQLAPFGRVVDGHVWLVIDTLRDAARPRSSSAEWDRDFRAMILYASASGWTDAGATSVRAHLEFEGPAAARHASGAPGPGAR